MRLLRNTLQFLIAFLLALTVYSMPIVSLIMGALLPDPVDVVIEQAPYREVSLVDAGPLLDRAFLPDADPEAPPEKTPEPAATVEPAAEETPPEKVPEAPPEAAPPKRASEPPPEHQKVDVLAREIENARLAQAKEKAAAKAKQRAEALAQQRVEAKKATEARKASSGGKGGGKKQKCAEKTPGVVALNEREYSIPREVVLHYASDLDAASKLAYVAWAHNEKGKNDGFVVKRIRCDSLLDQAGLKNGDIIHEVNGKNVNSIVQAFAAWRKVRKKDVVRIDLVRKGKKMEIKYHIE